MRECRGDGHLAACVAAGLTGLEANLLTELWVGYEPFAYAGTRAWSPDVMSAAQERLRDRGLLDGDGLSDAGRALREQVEQTTDTAMQPGVAALGNRLDDVVAHCDTWGQAVIERGWSHRTRGRAPPAEPVAAVEGRRSPGSWRRSDACTDRPHPLARRAHRRYLPGNMRRGAGGGCR